MHSKDVIDKHLKKLKKLDYNQFRWWRNYQVQKPLPKSTHIEKRINSGDFEQSPYFWMAQLALWEKYDSDNSNLEPFERVKRGGLLLSKFERLMHDFEVDDKDRLDLGILNDSQTDLHNIFYDKIKNDNEFKILYCNFLFSHMNSKLYTIHLRIRQSYQNLRIFLIPMNY